MNARRELWALACRLGPRAAGQLRLVAMQMLRRAEHAERRAEHAERRVQHAEQRVQHTERRAEQRNRLAAARAGRRWWIFVAGRGATVLGAEAPRG